MRKHKPDFVIALLVLTLMAISLIVIYAIGPRVAQFENSQNGGSLDEMYFARHHIFSVLMSIGALAAGYLFKHEWVKKFGQKILIAGFVLCFLVIVLGEWEVR